MISFLPSFRLQSNIKWEITIFYTRGRKTRVKSHPVFSLTDIYYVQKKLHSSLKFLTWNVDYSVLFSLIYTFSGKKSRKSTFFIISVYKIVILFTCIYIHSTHICRHVVYSIDSETMRAIRPKNEQQKKIIRSITCYSNFWQFHKI